MEIGSLEVSPIFIIGVGRSGTSLLQSMLHAHPTLAVLPETHFFRRYVARSRKREWHKRRGAEIFRTVLARDADYQRAGVSPDTLLAPYRQDKSPFFLADAYARLLALYQSRKKSTLVGVKDPRLIDYLPQLKKAFPEARVIHIVRDPRDVLLSRMKADWSSGRPAWLHLLTYRAQMKFGRREGKQHFGGQYLEVHYEHLLNDPEQTLREVATHIGVPYTDAMLSFGESAQELVDERERAWKKETLGPLLRDNTGKWRGELSAWQVRLAEQVCAEAFRHLGYKPAGEEYNVGPVQQVVLQMVPLVGFLFEGMYNVGRRFM